MNSPIPLVMIHGLLGSIDYFAPAERLGDLAIHTPDLLGYGANAGADFGMAMPPVTGPAMRPATPSVRESAMPTVAPPVSPPLAPPFTLDRQAHHVAEYLRRQVRRPAWLLGHSVGGAVAMLAAARAPEHVLGVVSVEGNFTLDDAFWCRQIAPLDPGEWQARYRALCSDEDAWLRGAGVEPTPQRAAWARRILDNQPATTVRAMARAVVAETGHADFLACVRRLVDTGLPIALLSGERSRPDWHVPSWVAAAASHDITVPDTGHMMMLESPQAFCRAVREIVEAGIAGRAQRPSR